MSINLIVACDVNYGIGYKNELLFRIKHDLQRFKNLTENHMVVMGRKTFESLPAPLPNRKNVVLTRNVNYKVPQGMIVENSFEQLLHYYMQTGEQDKDLWVIGGSEIYSKFMPYANKVHLTLLLNAAEKVDTYFPFDELEDFTVVRVDKCYSEEYECNYVYVTYEKNPEGDFNGEN